VAKILKAEPELKPPIPIEKLALQLDIGEIGELATEGFEGGLLTDEVRSFGGILVKKGMQHQRRRFTIGHELGHFLLPFHKPAKAGQFLCSRDDMRQWSAKENDRAAQMEVQANQFSALMLMPPPMLRKFIDRRRDPDLTQVLGLHEEFEVSKEAAARSFAEYHDQTIATVVVKDGKVLRIYKKRNKFPWMNIGVGDTVPANSSLKWAKQTEGCVSPLRQIGAEEWLETEYGKRPPELYEQVLPQARGFAIVLLWAEVPDEDDYDPDESRTAKQRYKDRSTSRF
tara:strand:+ start:740 stop:1591 length:852 start_codon:yes stop_codon:yes gene_type:complete